MLHIILGIIKGIGVVLLFLIALLFLFLLSILLVPVRYRGKCFRREKEFFVQGNFHWFLHLISIQIRYEGNGIQYWFHVCGLDIRRLGRLWGKMFRWFRRNSGEEKKENEFKTAQEELFVDDTAIKEEKSVTEALEAAEIQEEKKEKHSNFFAGGRRFFKAAANIPLTLRRLCDKIGLWKEFLYSEELSGALSSVWYETKGVLMHIRPKKIKGYVKFGFDDPSLTGQTLGLLSFWYLPYAGTLKIEPNFDRQMLEGDVAITGRFQALKFLIVFVRLYRNQNIKTVIGRL